MCAVVWGPGERAPTYDADSLVTYHKTPYFLADPAFRAAYSRGMNSGHHIARPPGSDDDVNIEWRVHVVLWAASQALLTEGDFVECGVNTGIYSLAICDYLDFNRTGRSFWLFDTFRGIPQDQISPREHELGRAEENAQWFSECYDLAKQNFAPFPRARLVRGRVPETLATVDIDRVSYLSLDMNIAEPEAAAFEHFWPRLSPGAVVVLDDYGWDGFAPQREVLDALAAERGVRILQCPTGQGLLVKPCAATGHGQRGPC